MKVVNLREAQTEMMMEEIAIMLHRAFPESDGWPTLELAREEVRESLADDWISLVALAGDGTVCGWIGGLESYQGNVYELHPLVVREGWRRQGLGTILVRALEERVKERGASTIYLGTDDTNHGTNIFGQDLYPNPLQHLERLESVNDHPVAFYRKRGYVVVGVLPDANGFGKPDIIMAKRV